MKASLTAVAVFSLMTMASIGSSMAHTSGPPSGGNPSGGNPSQTQTGTQTLTGIQTQTGINKQTGIVTDNSRTRSTSKSEGGAGGAATNGNVAGTVAGTVNVNNTTGGGPTYYPASRNNTPDVIAPNISGGGVCNVGVSGGVALPGFGVVGGGTWEGPKCELRMQVALLAQIGQLDAAVEMMCWDNMVLRNIRASQGHPCLQDRIRFAQMGVPGYVLLAPVAATLVTEIRRRQ